MMRFLSAAAVLASLSAPAFAQAPADPHAGHDMSSMPGMNHTTPAPESQDPHAGHDMSAMAGMGHGGHAMASTGVQGGYPMTRDASGTSWQPDAWTHDGVHGSAGGWSLMGHVILNGGYDWQGGPRGDEKAILSGMVMGAARRDFSGGDTLNLRAMLSPDPLMGARGYPLLLAAGESADGRTPLVDRQHPHDLFMELSASYSHSLGAKDSVFVYGGLPGEPAFGPPAFMHRQSGIDSPEAPITHHWLDSTHITFGVVTAGWVHDNWKLEASRFKGREPDRRRYDIESPKFDSTAVRLSWNPTANLSLQGSWAELVSPEALDPDQNERRWSASAIYTRPVGSKGLWSTTAAWGRKERTDGVATDGLLLETAFKPNGAWTLFARAERQETDELDAHAGHAHGDVETVGKLSVGVIRDFRVAAHAKLGVGGLYSFNSIPDGLEHAYGSSPNGAFGFVRVVID